MNDKLANDLIRYAELVEDGALILPEEMNCASVMRLAAEYLAQPEQRSNEQQEPTDEHGYPIYSNGTYADIAKAHAEFEARFEIERLKTQPEQRSVRTSVDSEHLEPVAWLWELTGEVTTDPDRADGMWKPLYTTPPQRTAAEGEDTRRAWVGLTDDERWNAYTGGSDIINLDYAKAIEAKLKEKNNGTR